MNLLAVGGEAAYRTVMGTLPEIEAAVDRLTPVEQQRLLEHLQQKLWSQPGDGHAMSREEWIQRLRKQRTSISTRGPAKLTTEQILDDLREDRF